MNATLKVLILTAIGAFLGGLATQLYGIRGLILIAPIAFGIGFVGMKDVKR